MALNTWKSKTKQVARTIICVSLLLATTAAFAISSFLFVGFGFTSWEPAQTLSLQITGSTRPEPTLTTTPPTTAIPTSVTSTTTTMATTTTTTSNTTTTTPSTTTTTTTRQCDIYSGNWVHDESYPLYPAGECPLMSVDFSCKQNGRVDSEYTKWRWQPTRCNLPRLDPKDMLERLRGKRLMFVGDSINRNQWDSLLCILRTAVAPNRTHKEFKNGSAAYIYQDYNCSVEFFWASFLVEPGSIEVGNTSKDILELDSIERHGAHWKGVDILVFNSGHWWLHGNKVQTQDYFKEGNYLHPQLDKMVAYRKGLSTWAKWIDENMDPTKSKVFFRGFSPMHFSSSQWNKPGHQKCKFERDPILNESYVGTYPEIMNMVEEVLTQMNFPVHLMNITSLSDFRKDAHPSIYRMKMNKNLLRKERKNPYNVGDCSHWCLPGLPDIWNELLYGNLILLSEGLPLRTTSNISSL